MPERPHSQAEDALHLFRCLKTVPQLTYFPDDRADVIAQIMAIAKAEGGLTNLGISAKEWQEVVGSPYRADLVKPPVDDYIRAIKNTSASEKPDHSVNRQASIRQPMTPRERLIARSEARSVQGLTLRA